MKNITKSMVDILYIPKGRNEWGWYVYVGMVEDHRIEFRFDYRPSLRKVKERMLDHYNRK